jgi:hypothetical protein
VALSCVTTDAVIRFTLERLVARRDQWLHLHRPIGISNTTILRLIALKPGWRPSDVDTHSYLFIRDTLAQSNSPALPATWGGFPADYAMDPRIVTNATWRTSLSNDLRSLPILSLVLDPNDLFRANGIYANPFLTGLASERACSAEYFFPDGARTGFSVKLRPPHPGRREPLPHGGGQKEFPARLPPTWGPGALDYALFPGNPVTRFQTLRLKAYFGDGWTVPARAPEGFQLRARSMGRGHASGRWATPRRTARTRWSISTGFTGVCTA